MARLNHFRSGMDADAGTKIARRKLMIITQAISSSERRATRTSPSRCARGGRAIQIPSRAEDLRKASLASEAQIKKEKSARKTKGAN